MPFPANYYNDALRENINVDVTKDPPILPNSSRHVIISQFIQKAEPVKVAIYEEVQ